MRKLDSKTLEQRERIIRAHEITSAIDALWSRLRLFENVSGAGIDKHKAQWRRDLSRLRGEQINIHEGKPVTARKKSQSGRREFAAFK